MGETIIRAEVGNWGAIERDGPLLTGPAGQVGDCGSRKEVDKGMEVFQARKARGGKLGGHYWKRLGGALDPGRGREGSHLGPGGAQLIQLLLFGPPLR